VTDGSTASCHRAIFLRLYAPSFAVGNHPHNISLDVTKYIYHEKF
jgi:hypothetical protein